MTNRQRGGWSPDRVTGAPYFRQAIAKDRRPLGRGLGVVQSSVPRFVQASAARDAERGLIGHRIRRIDTGVERAGEAPAVCSAPATNLKLGKWVGPTSTRIHDKLDPQPDLVVRGVVASH
ncbi:hypothetical protein K456DRAFT_1602774 [Colletotrichum gloeosporioides 23]|nr:hypothetical protein K456DRAFT_1602774 [Colletotrichum gloeosporioides 23]